MSLIFRKPTIDDAGFFYELRLDPTYNEFNPLVPSTIEMLKERISRSASEWKAFAQAEAYLWFLEKDGTLVGSASIQNINRMMLTAEIGYAIKPCARGQGLATRAVTQLTRDAFENTPLRKLSALVHEKNHASRRVLLNAGFTEEGFLREHYLVNGAPVNEVLFGILKREVI